jgi:hypothetical protein
MGRDSLRDFIAHHDDRWLFVVVYITLAVVLSLALSLFWLVAVAALHFGLEYLRQAQYRTGRRDIVSHALWEIKLDIALVLLALALALYMDVMLGVLGLQSAARAAAATRVARFAAWERNLRAVVLLGDDVARVVQIGVSRALRRRADTPQPVVLLARRDGTQGATLGGVEVPVAAVRPAPAAAAAPRSWRDAWTTGDRFTVALLAASLMLIVTAPLVTDHTWTGATLALLAELHPFPLR